MNNLNNINTLQNLTDITYLTSYTNEYLISALANLGQRSNIKDNYIVYETLKLEDILTDGYGAGLYCMQIDSSASSAGMANLGVKYFHIDSGDDYSINDIISNLQTQYKTLFTDINFVKKYDYTLYNSINNIDSYDVYFMQVDSILNIYYIGYLNNEEVQYGYYKLDISKKNSENATYTIQEGLIYYNLAIYTDNDYQSYWTRIYFENVANMVIPDLDNSSNKYVLPNDSINDDTESSNQYYLYCVQSDFHNQDNITAEGYLPNEYVVKYFLNKESAQSYMNSTSSFLQVLQAIIDNNTEEVLKPFNPETESIKDIILNHIIAGKLNPVYPIYNTITGTYSPRYTVSAFSIDELNTNLTEICFPGFNDIEEVKSIEGIIQKEYLHLLNPLTDTYFNTKFSSSSEVQKYIIFKLIQKALDGFDEDAFVVINSDFSIKYIHDKNNLLYIYSLLNYFHGEFFSLDSTKNLSEYGDFNNYLNYFYCWNPISTTKEVERVNENRIVVYNVEINDTNTEYDEVIHGFEVNEVYTLPYIDSNGEWIINNKITNYSSVGEDAGNPNMFYIVQENEWVDDSSSTPSTVSATAYFNEELAQYFNNSNNLYSQIDADTSYSFILPGKSDIKYYEKLSNYLSCTHITHNSYSASYLSNSDNYVLTFWNYNTNQSDDDQSGSKDNLWKSINDSNGNTLQLTLLSSLKDYISELFNENSNYAISSIAKEAMSEAILSYIDSTESLSTLMQNQISAVWNTKNIGNAIVSYLQNTSYYASVAEQLLGKYVLTYLASTEDLDENWTTYNMSLAKRLTNQFEGLSSYVDVLATYYTKSINDVQQATTYASNFRSYIDSNTYLINSYYTTLNNSISYLGDKYQDIYQTSTNTLSDYQLYKATNDNNITNIKANISTLSKKIDEMYTKVETMWQWCYLPIKDNGKGMQDIYEKTATMWQFCYLPIAPIAYTTY